MQRDWYVVYSKPYKEEQVQLHLGLKGIESFFPRLEMPGSTNRGKTITPLFPNYLLHRERTHQATCVAHTMHIFPLII